MLRAASPVSRRALAGLTAAAVVAGQLVFPPRADASHLGSATASAGSAPPPQMSIIQNFQPDLFTGRATTSVPIALPPGRKGLQPSLALAYASSSRNGWLGVGWSLDAGYIERSTKNGVPKYDGSDVFSFVFQGVASDLVQIPDGTYRAKDEGLFLRVESKGTSGWEARDKSGTRYLFGQTAASQIVSTGKAFRWALDKVSDVHGNTVTYSYATDQGQLYLSQIRYTGHEPTGLAPSNQVDFTLEARPDAELSYRSGFPITTAKRLKTIEAKATVSGAVSLARRYQLAYTASARTGRSLLTGFVQFGTDGTTSLPATAFTYASTTAPAYPVTTASANLKFLLTGDVDGNGTAEFLNFDPAAGSWTVSCAQSCPGLTTGAWLSGFGTSQHTPLLGDWNGDGKTDIAVFKLGAWQFAVSTGTSFQTGTPPAITFGSGMPFEGDTPFTGDFNGDGKTDIGTYKAGQWSIALATPTGFVARDTFMLTLGTTNHEPLVGDFNGDGFTDIALSDNQAGHVQVAFSNGTSFVPQTTSLVGFGPGQPHTSADLSEDDRSDVLYYDRAAGRIRLAVSTGAGFTDQGTLAPVFTQTSTSDVLQIGDFNGDGLMDFAVFNTTSGSTQLALSQGVALDLLTNVANGLGGTTTLAYQPSTQLSNTRLPFITQVVNEVTIGDGLGHTYRTTYQYDGGVYDAPTKEFRGFAAATVVDAENNTTRTTFLQDEHEKGRPAQSEFRDATGTLWTKSLTTWSCSEMYPGVHFTRLDQTDSFTYDGDATFRQTRSRFTYDAYGNVTQTIEDGDVGVTGDERTSTSAFTLNPTAWILNRPAVVQTLDAAGVVIAQRRFYYDGASSTAALPTLGDLTREEEWLNAPTEQWLATSLAYDAYGNVAGVTDALGRTTANTYDAGGTYLTRIQNALGHSRQLAYDARLGQVTSSTDQNNQTTTTEYDALGRVTNVIGPLDTAALPTMSYAYDLSTVPSKTSVSTRIQSGQPAMLTVHAFADGLGRTIQTRAPAEDPAKQVVTGAVELNSRGLAVKQWVSYLSTASTAYVPIASESSFSTLAFVSSTYDPLGRTLTVTEPDGSVSSTSYSDWTVTATDALGHQTRRASDAYGRLVTVEELNPPNTYTTRYQYDAANRLTRVTDHAGNATVMAYDSLGRKLSMDDPDMGHWTYGYDAVDNLTNQTDARGVVINFAYDALNRLTQKSYTIPSPSTLDPSPPVTYAYDDAQQSFATGKLTSVADGSGSSRFIYDQLGRLITETKILDGTTYTIQRAYDLPGRLTTLTYPDGDTAAYTYNAQGGIETVMLHTADSTQQTEVIQDIQYNAAGQVTKIHYGNGTVSDYTYNPQTLRLSSLVTRHSSLGTTLQDFSYTFDALGNVTAITDRAHTGTQSFQYDALNRLTRAVGAYGVLNYAYDPLGNMTSKEGMGMTYGLQGGAKPHAITSTSNGLALTYDANGNLLVKDFTQSPSHSFTQSLFSYDADNRLIEVQTAPEETATLTFQPGWNFVSLPVLPDDAHISAVLPNFSADFEQVAWFDAAVETPDNQRFQHFVNDPVFNDFDTFEYGQGYQVYCKNPQGVTITLRGKLPMQPTSTTLLPGWHLVPAHSTQPTALSTIFSSIDAAQILKYDAALSSLTPATEIQPGAAYFVQVATASTWTPPLPRDPTTRFVYDGDGGRVKQVTASGTTRFLGESLEIAPDGLQTKYVFTGSQRIAAKDSTGTLRFYHSDHLGSSNLITDGAGQVVELAEHTPYGALHRREGSANVPQKFTGQRADASTGLYFYHARYYDPTLGRFTQPDTFVQDPSDPQTLNRYAYVRNNPINFVDPSGHFFWFIAAVIHAIVEYAIAHAAQLIITAAAAVVSATISANQREEKSSPTTSQAFVSSSRSAGKSPGQTWSNVATNPAVAQGASFIAGFVPIAGELQDGVATFVGVDVFTGERLPLGWRLASGAALFIPFVGAVQIRQGVRALNELVPNGAKYIYDATVRRYRHVTSGRFVAGRNLPFPANEGFRIRNRGTLKPGQMIDRYGSPHGGFASDVGASISSRGLPPGSEALEYHRYRVMHPLNVEMGPAAAVPEFAATGGAKQYLFDRPISELVDEGYLR
ncbi:MAG: glycohydrolase toxin TNT-related protein [Candidatus Omnitrophica bacterium]|nr:glycohydrolase toxin TNT-related protein [Candidatus Omnitrophota bacterium]